MSARAASGFMTYPNDCTASIAADFIELGRPMGPNYMGEAMWPVSAEYDAESNTTRVGFSLIAPAVSA